MNKKTNKEEVLNKWLVDDGFNRDAIELAENIGLSVNTVEFKDDSKYRDVLALLLNNKDKRYIFINRDWNFGGNSLNLHSLFVVCYLIAEDIRTNPDFCAFYLEDMDLETYKLAKEIFVRSQKYKNNSSYCRRKKPE